MNRRIRIFAALTLLAIPTVGQETRSTINGRVYDIQTAAVDGAAVTITHTDTGTTPGVSKCLTRAVRR
jgi:hypothetical protein